MGLFKKTNFEIEEKLKESFAVEYFTIGTIQFGGSIIACLVKFKDEAYLKKYWKELNSYLTAKFIPTVEDDYSKWNFYIFYFSKTKVDKPLKYEIENNKFSSRKIVIEDYKSITTEVIESVISEHIVNDNIQLNLESKKVPTFKKNASLEKILDKLKSNKKSDDDLQKVLDQLEQIYKDEVHKS
jgi:hypothetical protein